MKYIPENPHVQKKKNSSLKITDLKEKMGWGKTTQILNNLTRAVVLKLCCLLKTHGEYLKTIDALAPTPRHSKLNGMRGEPRHQDSKRSTSDGVRKQSLRTSGQH